MTDKELMQQALEALDIEMPFGAYLELRNALRERLAQPEPVTGNLLEDAYNAMVEKKTRSQRLREAGFTRRPKGWEKEKDEQEPVAHTLNCVCGAVWDVRFDGVEEMVHAPTPPQREWIGLTGEEVKEIIDKYTIDDHGFDIWCDGLGVVKAVEDKLRSKNI